MGEMEIEEIEVVLEKIWDLYDKLSDEIHLISRSHFLKSVKPSNRSEKRKNRHGNYGEDKRPGYVFIKGFAVDDNDSTIQEAKSLNAIRTALENLEDQLEVFHTVVPLNTWVLISNFKLAYNLLRRPDGTFNRHLAETGIGIGERFFPKVKKESIQRVAR